MAKKEYHINEVLIDGKCCDKECPHLIEDRCSLFNDWVLYFRRCKDCKTFTDLMDKAEEK